MEVDLKTIKDKVQHLLENKAKTRESDMLLVLEIWKEECDKKGIKTLHDFFAQFENGAFTHFESVRRDRCAFQKNNPALRGANYEQRRKKQKIVAGDLNTLFG